MTLQKFGKTVSGFGAGPWANSHIPGSGTESRSRPKLCPWQDSSVRNLNAPFVSSTVSAFDDDAAALSAPFAASKSGSQSTTAQVVNLRFLGILCLADKMPVPRSRCEKTLTSFLFDPRIRNKAHQDSISQP